MALQLFNRKTSEGEEMSFVDHLESLRWHIIRALLAIIVAAILIFIKLDWIVDNVIQGPIRNDFISYRVLCDFSHWLRLGDSLCMPPIPPGYKLLGTSVSGPFTSAIQIGLMGGLILAFPYVFWEFWRFIKPALSPKELKYSQKSIFWVSFCFFLGAGFGYFVLGPFTFNFLANFTLGTTGMYEYKPSLTDYLDTLLDLILGCGIAFELPILSYILTKIGLVTPMFLKSYRKYAYVAILVVAAIITPSPDWTSQMIVTLPLAILYEVSIIISSRVYKYEKKKENEEWS
jgi:sec-independent protein translocase protein TatC